MEGAQGTLQSEVRMGFPTGGEPQALTFRCNFETVPLNLGIRTLRPGPFTSTFPGLACGFQFPIAGVLASSVPEHLAVNVANLRLVTI